MTLTPLADRVLIRPSEQPTQTASGLHLAEHWKPEQTGTIVATGVCAHPRKDDAHELAQKLDTMALSAYPDFHKERIQAAAKLLRGLTAREPEVQIGDTVIFSWNVGQEVWVNDGEERYLLMREADILAVIEGVEA